MKYVIANWKMNQDQAAAKDFLSQLAGQACPPDTTVVICPPFTLLPLFSQQSTLKYGAQNMHWEESGAFTGEVSVLMLKELGCQYVIIGHSERRRYFEETDEIINKKLTLAIKHNITPIFCVGETLEQRQSGQTKQIIEKQIKTGLPNLQPTTYKLLIIAYEPVWAIGTGQNATPEQAQEIHQFIHTLVSPKIPVIYGGSVKADNSAELLAQQDIDGALVGGASLDPQSFLKIVNS